LRLRISLVRLPLLSAFSNSVGTTSARTALILQLEHDGVEAFSECATDEALSSTKEDNSEALRVIRETTSRILRPEPPSPREFREASLRGEGVERRGHPMASAAVEMLLWDYAAKRRGVPLDELLGESRGQAEAGIALGLAGGGGGSRDETLSWIEAAVARGYKRVKVKIERESALERLEVIRGAFPRIPLSADANGCFDLQRDETLLRKIDGFELRYLEQPLMYEGHGNEDLLGHSRLAKEISTPVCLDESITTVERAEEALDVGAASVINIKPGRVGGIANAVEIGRLARSRGAHVWVGGMLETGVGRAFNVAIASQTWVDLPGDTSPNDRYFARDIVENPFEMKDGSVYPNGRPGIGIVIDERTMAEVTQRTWTVF
jgi:o-succinylbenzoate synthase